MARKRRRRSPAGRRRTVQARSRRRSSITKRIEDTEKAIETLGEKNVRRGPKPLGQTGRITPTRAGFRAVDRVLKSINRVNRVGRRRIFTYDLEGSYRGPDGKMKKFSRKQIGIPRLKDVRRKKGESQTQALNRVVRTRIRREVMTILRQKLKGGSPPGKFKGRPISRKKAEEALRRFKKTRDVKFRVKFSREV